MRSFEQRIAEIDRGSEKIFKERKKRRLHLLVAGVPLVLCIGLYAVSILPAMMPKSAGASSDSIVCNGIKSETAESLTCSVAQIEVSGIGVLETYTEISDIMLISEQLSICTVQEPESSIAAQGGTQGEQVDDHKEMADEENTIYDIFDEFAAEGYTITLTTHDGTITEYCLSGNTLMNRTLNESYFLTQEQLNELKKLLGIPD